MQWCNSLYLAGGGGGQRERARPSSGGWGHLDGINDSPPITFIVHNQKSNGGGGGGHGMNGVAMALPPIVKPLSS